MIHSINQFPSALSKPLKCDNAINWSPGRIFRRNMCCTMWTLSIRTIRMPHPTVCRLLLVHSPQLVCAPFWEVALSCRQGRSVLQILDYAAAHTDNAWEPAPGSEILCMYTVATTYSRLTTLQHVPPHKTFYLQVSCATFHLQS
jgi:hypothetical protein